MIGVQIVARSFFKMSKSRLIYKSKDSFRVSTVLIILYSCKMSGVDEDVSYEFSYVSCQITISDG
jgi:hypothetical protein